MANLIYILPCYQGSQGMSAAIIVVSDTCARDSSQDSVGPLISEEITKCGFETKVEYVADEKSEIANKVSALATQHQLLLTTGGTGLGKRDVTPEAVTPLLEKQAPGMVAAMLNYGLEKTELAALGRPVAGMIGGTVVLCVPGSKGGALDSWRAVKGVVQHALDVWAKGRAAHDAKDQDSQGQSLGRRHGHHHNRSIGCRNSHSHSYSHSHSHSHSFAHSGPVFYTNASRPRSSPFPLIPFSEALALVLDRVPEPKAVSIPVEDSIGYVVAEDVHSPLNVPPFRASIVDGYAVLHSDCPSTFPVKTVSLTAGDITWFERHTCIRITTGAPVPHGATAVVPVEDTDLVTEEDGEEVEVRINASGVKSGDNIRDIGSDIPLGSLVLGKGTTISMLGGEIGAVSALGLTKISVWERPSVAVMSTGDEVVDPGQPCTRNSQIWDVNRPMLIAALRAKGYPYIDCGIISDTRENIRNAISQALKKADILITSGGVSMGELDLLKPIIEELGGEIHFGRVEMKPGKPVTFATIGDKFIFALPGNPASAAVCYQLFVGPFLTKLSGGNSAKDRIQVKIDFDAKLDPRPEFQRVHARATTDGWVASTTGFQRSSVVKSMVAANALLCLPSGTGTLSKGTLVEAILLDY